MPDYDFRVDLGAMINAATNTNDSLKAPPYMKVWGGTCLHMPPHIDPLQHGHT